MTSAFIPITEIQLSHIMPNVSLQKIALHSRFMNPAMQEFLINTTKRQAAFVAQIAHETAELRYSEEIWCATPAQLRYEGRKDLGNTQPHDGYRFRGRGAFQLTGRNNYYNVGKKLKLDLVGNPDLAALPQNSYRIAGLFWQAHALNQAADMNDFNLITLKINGGFNGLNQRRAYWLQATQILKKARNEA